MPSYNDLRPDSDPNIKEFSLIFHDFKKEQKIRTIDNLLKLRSHLSANLEVRKTDKNLLLSSWNIKEFGHLKKRLPEAYFYIAEIISNFDLVAIQEVKTGLKDLEILMKLLGKDWSYLINDITEGRDGNSERSAYLYDTRRVNFTGLAGEILLWKELFDESETDFQLKRTPYVTSFRSGWKTFSLLNVHLQPNDNQEGREIRKKEVTLLMKALEVKRKRKTNWTENIIILGDFNLYNKEPDNATVKIFENFQYKESDLLQGLNTNVANSKQTFDRMFFHQNEYFKTPCRADGNKGGVIDMFEIVFREDDFINYKEEMKAQKEDPSDLTDDAKFKKYFKDYWRRTQLSDHKPIWVEISIDSSDTFLEEKRKELEAQL